MAQAAKNNSKSANPIPVAEQNEKVIRSYFRGFKIKNPISHFKEIFKKEVDQQWLIVKASFVQLVIQSLNLGALTLTQSRLDLRMEFEENEQKRTQYALLFHLLSWVLLCYLRRKHFKLPKNLALMTMNIFTLSYLYLTCYSLVANTWGDPNSKIIYYSFIVSDCFFSFLYLALSDYIYPSGHVSFCAFPKFFFAICFYFFFDDRFKWILQAFLITTFSNFFQGLVAEELLGDCYHENITEFGVFDHYTLLFLDLPYIFRKSYEGVADNIQLLRERWFSTKQLQERYDRISEEEEQEEEKEESKRSVSLGKEKKE